MKILLVHTYYKHRGGEDQVFDQEVNLLNKTHNVQIITFFNQTGLVGALQFLVSIFNIYNIFRIYKKINDFDPDIIHVHNFHFALGPLFFYLSKIKTIPIVHTIHNYRLLCPSGNLLYNNKLFTDSITKQFPWHAIFKKVYRESYLQTFWLAFVFWFHRLINSWSNISRFIFLTDFSSALFLTSTFSKFIKSYSIKPNFTTPFNNLDKTEKKDYFVFVGRFSEEKGIELLIEAFKKIDYTIMLIGDGPYFDLIKQSCKNYSNIHLLGKQSSENVRRLMADATALVFPSICYEGMPMTIIEAFSVGTPIICSKLGAMTTMVRHEYNGLFFEPNDIHDLCYNLQKWIASSSFHKNEYYRNAFTTYHEHYTPQKNLDLLTSIYEDVLSSFNK